jgi:hypothetical protein
VVGSRVQAARAGGVLRSRQRRWLHGQWGSRRRTVELQDGGTEMRSSEVLTWRVALGWEVGTGKEEGSPNRVWLRDIRTR